MSFGATSGAIMGGIAGLLVGLGALAIPGIGPAIAAGTLATTLGTTAAGAGLGALTGGLIGALVAAGIPEDEANVYAEGIRRGGTLLMVNADNEMEANRAVEIMRRHHVVDINRRRQEFMQSGWSKFDQNAAPYRGTQHTANTSGTQTLERGGEARIPVIEEELQVGKRTVESGGVRVNTQVEQKPVNEQITTRHETVDVERRPVNRPITNSDVQNFQEGTFEVRERHEQPVVQKQARVVEEIGIKKNVEERTQHVQDTVRRTDVDVEQLPGQTHTTGYQNRGTTNYQSGTSSMPGSTTNEGMIERNISKAGNSLERGLDADLDQDGDVGQRDPRNNY